MRENFHGYAVSDIHTAWRHRILGAPTCERHSGYGISVWDRCTCEATPEIPQWVILAWARERFGRIPRDKVSSAFRHNHAERVAPKPARAKAKRFRNDERSQYGGTDKREYMRPRFTDDEAAHLAEACEDAREFADMDAIADDGFERVAYEREGTTLCERAYWMPEVDDRACDCWACEDRRIDILHLEAVTQAPTDGLADLMEQAPLGAPVVPVLA